MPVRDGRDYEKISRYTTGDGDLYTGNLPRRSTIRVVVKSHPALCAVIAAVGLMGLFIAIPWLATTLFVTAAFSWVIWVFITEFV